MDDDARITFLENRVNELETKLNERENELNETRAHLKKYTAPASSKIYYERHKEEQKQRAREYKKRTNSMMITEKLICMCTTRQPHTLTHNDHST